MHMSYPTAKRDHGHSVDKEALAGSHNLLTLLGPPNVTFAFETEQCPNRLVPIVFIFGRSQPKPLFQQNKKII